MNYYNENTNKIRRRKVSLNDSASINNDIEINKNINNIKSEKVKKRSKRIEKNNKLSINYRKLQ